MAQAILEKVYQSIPYLLSFPSSHSWIDYDREADVLYINFQKPTPASDSELTEDDIIIRKKGDLIIGLTVLNASQRA